MAHLEINDLWVSVSGKEILKGVSLNVEKGELAALMGPNGSGKSTLAMTLMGHPKYKIDKGSIVLGGKDITNLSPSDRAKSGLFLSFQYPSEIPGVSVENFLRTAYSSVRGNIGVMDFHKLLLQKFSALGIPDAFAMRSLNEGFSGGEKKKMEILQLSILQPSMAVLDETDSGLDVDALKSVANGISDYAGPSSGILLITHYQRILSYLKPDSVHVMVAGRIVISGKSELAKKIEENGYDWVN